MSEPTNTAPEADATVTTDATNTEATVETTEATPAEATSETTEATPATETEAAPAGPTEEETAALAEAFDTAVKTAVDGRDADTGEIKSEDLTGIQTAFKALNTGQRKTAKASVEASLKESLTVSLDIILARAYLEISENMGKGRAPAAESAATVVLDPTAEYIKTQMAYYVAGQLIPVPSDVDADWATQLQAGSADILAHVPAMREYMAALATWNAEETHAEGATAPEMPKDMPAALIMSFDLVSGTRKRTAGRKTGTSTPRTPRAASVPRTGAQGSIGKHVASFFAALPVGASAKFADIAKAVTAEYPDGNASGGAIAAYFDRNNLANSPGIVAATVDGRKGAKKVA